MQGYVSDQQLLDDLKNYISKNGIPTNRTKTFKAKNGLCSWETYESHLGGKLVDWIQMCGIELSKDEIFTLTTRGVPNQLSKDDCIKIIYDMQSKLNRPLMYDDFRGSYENHLGITQVKKYWGTVNKMKAELGLEIIQESMIDKQLSKEDFDNMINDIKNFTLTENKDFITTKEIDSNKDWAMYGTLDRMCKKYYNIKLSDHLNNYEIRLGKQGSGLNFNFKDGEHTTSQFEYMFSKFLKNYGLQYNQDYFRDVKYSKIINDYKGQMNCDYLIEYKGNKIYIEIAGIILDYKQWYYSDKEITSSKSKENYRLKLKEKENMLNNNGLIYFILFPCDLTIDNFTEILENPTIELRKRIENMNKTNIDWKRIQKTTGILEYEETLGKDGQPNVKYE